MALQLPIFLERQPESTRVTGRLHFFGDSPTAKTQIFELQALRFPNSR